MMDDRPTADEMLARVRAETGTDRGRLRVYLGMAPGVGKTFRMLEEAHRRVARGTDLVVGFVEPHGRPETVKLLDGLEIIPRREVEYRGVVLEEMDTDAVIARKPAVALVDELAHTNVPGSARMKRWEDVEAILDAGINVVSTLNVQHLESVADAVSTITGAPVNERLPDDVLEGAEEVELVDMSPHALRQRMRHGNVYAPDRAMVALDRFFTEANLTALRELALRFTAGRVDEQLRDIMTEQGIKKTWAVASRLAVPVDHHRESRAVLRRGAEMAATMRADLMALVIDTPADVSRGVDRDQDLRENLAFAEELGAEVVRLEAASQVDGLVDAVQQRRITHVLMAYEPSGRLGGLLSSSLAESFGEQTPGGSRAPPHPTGESVPSRLTGQRRDASPASGAPMPQSDPPRPPRPPGRIDPFLEVREKRRGRRQGDAYVKIVRPYEELFERGDQGELIATERTVLQRPGWTRSLRAFRTFLIGRPISSEREEHERLTKLKALAIFSSDNISSSAYATEEMMRILVVAGIGAVALTMPLTIAICIVLAIVATSYWQTIRAYPIRCEQLPGGERQPRFHRRARGRGLAPDRLHAHGRRVGLCGGCGHHVGRSGAVS